MAVLKTIRSFLCKILQLQITETPARNLGDLDKLCSTGQLEEALDIMEQRNISISRNNAYYILKECCKMKHIECGRRVQLLMEQTELDSVAVLGDHLIRLFASCGCLDKAKGAFGKISKPTVYTWTAIILAHSELGQPQYALNLYQNMQVYGLKTSPYIYAAVLKACTITFNIDQGKQVHKEIICNEFEFDIILWNALIDMYAKCGCLDVAREVFDKLPNQNVVSWNAMISGYAHQGEGLFALNCFYNMLEQGFKPDIVTFSSVLNVCGIIRAIEKGRQVHEQIISSGLQFDVVLSNTLVDMYVKCETLEEARIVFVNLRDRNVISWNTMISGYTQHGENLHALDCFNSMVQKGFVPDLITFSSILNSCEMAGVIEYGRHIHEQIIGLGMQSAMGGALVSMYVNCGSLKEGEKFFNSVNSQTLMVWNAMVAGYVAHGKGRLALECYHNMEMEGMKPDRNTFLGILKACGQIRAIEQGKYIHNQIIDSKFYSDIFVGNALIAMHAKCGNLEEAYEVFINLPDKDVVSWNTMIVGYSQHGELCLALECYSAMQQEGIIPDAVTFSATLKACGSIDSVRHIHEQIIKSGYETNVFVGNTLVDMYAKYGSLNEVQRIFDQLPQWDVVSWNTIIAGYAHHGESKLALEYFNKMQSEDMKPNSVTFSIIIKICGNAGFLERGRHIHEQIIKRGLQYDIFVCNTLMDMYVKCLSMEEAGMVFDTLPDRDVVSWNAIIAGFSQCHESILALQYFDNMKEVQISPDRVTLLSVLTICGNVGAIGEGRCIHEHVLAGVQQFDVALGSAMVDMYAKCGSLEEAQQVFESLQEWDVVLWDVMIGAYAQHGECFLALECFADMQHQKIEPDATTFTAILNGCRHAGLVDEGCWYFKLIAEFYAVTLDTVHSNCLADLLARAGCFTEAEGLVEVTQQPNIVGWMSLLNACNMHVNLELGQRCFNEIIRLDSACGAAYVLMSNVSAGKEVTISKLRKSY